MIPIYQDDFTFTTGNCMSACIASVLHLQLSEVPNFCVGVDFPPSSIEFAEACYTKLRDWSSKLGFFLLDIKFAEGQTPEDWLRDSWLLATGKSPRATEDWHRHCVVWRNGRMVHDPHPGGNGLDGKPELFSAFVMWNPAASILEVGE